MLGHCLVGEGHKEDCTNEGTKLLAVIKKA